jgi:transmembrane sensor
MTTPMESPVTQGGLAMVQAAAWVVRLGGDATGEDGVEFDVWLDAAPGNRAAYRQALALWCEFDARAGDVLAELSVSAHQTPSRPPAARRTVPRAAQAGGRRRTALRWLTPIGGFALAAGLALAVLPPTVLRPAATTTYATGTGQHQRVALADGSVIDLDAETRLRVTFAGSERRVALAEGQAIFDVVHDPRRPFIVQAGGRTVRDVGTQFDVRQRAGEFTVTVARGRVEVGPDGSGQPILLGPGQRLEVDRASAGQLSVVDPAETFSWRAGRLVYRAQPLADVVADLNRQFVEQTTISDPELGKLPITGVIVLDNPRAVMTRLSLMLPIRAVSSDKGLKLLRK